MNKKMSLILVGTIFAGGVLGFSAYKFLDFNSTSAQKAETSKQNNPSQEGIQKPSQEQTDNNIENEDLNNDKDTKVSDDLGQSLFNKTLANYYNSIYYFYENENNTYDKLENNVKLTIAYLNLKDNDKELSSYAKNDDYFGYLDNCLNEENGTYSCYYERTTKDNFEKAYKSIFGKTNISYENFYPYVNYQCLDNNNYIECNYIESGDDVSTYTFLKYEQATKVDNDIILEVSILKYDDTEKTFYSDLNISKKIGTDQNVPNFDSIYSYIEGTKKTDDLFKAFASKAGKFKVTFKLNKETNDYYWYKSQYIS